MDQERDGGPHGCQQWRLVHEYCGGREPSTGNLYLYLLLIFCHSIHVCPTLQSAACDIFSAGSARAWAADHQPPQRHHADPRHGPHPPQRPGAAHRADRHSSRSRPSPG